MANSGAGGLRQAHKGAASSGSKDSQVIRLTIGKERFEVIGKPGAAQQFKDGKLGFDNVLIVDMVFHNASKRDAVPPNELNDAFGTENMDTILRRIVTEGEIQLLAADRKAKLDQKTAEIVTYISKYYVEPPANRPIPRQRIELALEQVNVRIDMDEPAERQAPNIVKAFQELNMAMRKMEMECRITLPHSALGSAMGVVHRFCTINQENYTGEGCEMVVTIVPGDYDILLSELLKNSNGEANVDIIGGENVMASTEDDSGGKKKKGRGGGGAGAGAGAGGGGRGRGGRGKK